MNKSKNISLYSIFADDFYYDENRKLLKKEKGGPAFFIVEVFKKEKINFSINALTGRVGILMSSKGEFGKITGKPKKTQIDFLKIKEEYVVVSSLLNDFNFKNISKFRGKIFLDVQGYVRSDLDFGCKKELEVGSDIMKYIFCLKGTEEELRYVPKKIIENQKEKILLITKGADGCELYAFGKHYDFKINTIIKTSDTVGAGDTFFAYFISNFVRNNDVMVGVKYSIKKTSDFLKTKN